MGLRFYLPVSELPRGIGPRFSGLQLLVEAVVLTNHGSALFDSHLACMQKDPVCKAFFSCKLGHGLCWTLYYKLTCLRVLIYQRPSATLGSCMFFSKVCESLWLLVHCFYASGLL